MLTKRTLQLGGYDTASHGWTLTGLEFPEPLPVTNFVDVPGRSRGALDLSRALTGEPTYSTRDLHATLELSEGDHSERESRIAALINQHHGRREEIILPDRPSYYAVGQLTITKLFNNHAHASVEITGVCEPWLYAGLETTATLQAASTEKSTTIYNQGAMPVVPVLTVTGGSVALTYNGATQNMAAGTYKWPHLYLTPGEHAVKYKGSGQMTITFREAVLR